MRMIKITEDKKDKLCGYAEKILSAAGKMMQCIEALEEDEAMGERYSRMGMRDDDDEDLDWEGYGERRGVRGTGRYSRYRR